MAEYEVLSSRMAHRGSLSNVRVDEVAMPDGGSAEREVVEHANAVAVVAIDPQGQVVLIRHYRHPARTRLLEIPAGKLDVDGESPPDAAKRELAEEVGLEADDLTELLHFHNSAGWTEEETTIYLATDVRACATPDGFTAEHEESDLPVQRLPLEAALALVDAGEIRDAKTVIGLLLAHRHLANDGNGAAS